MQAKKMWIGGEWCDAEDGARADIIDPSNGNVIATTPKATLSDVERCVEASKMAFQDDSWKKMDPAQRGRIMQKIAPSLNKIYFLSCL